MPSPEQALLPPLSLASLWPSFAPSVVSRLLPSRPPIDATETTELLAEVRALREALERRERADMMAEHTRLTSEWDRRKSSR